MRVVLQRTSGASVTIAGEEAGHIGNGLVVLAGFGPADAEMTLRRMLDKILTLRIFADEDGKMNRSVVEVAGALLIVSQFTLFADCRKGRRPSYTDAAPPAEAERLYDRFVAMARDTGIEVATGRFGAMMDVALVNDGPVTIWLDSEALSAGG